MLAEQLVGEARARHPRGMNPRERSVLGVSAALFLLAAVAIAVFMPSEREFQPLLLVGLVAAYALISRVRFEVGNWFVVPESLVFVPLVLLAPLPYVPLLVALASVLSVLPELINGSWHKERAVTCLSDCWFAIGPVLVLAWLAPGEPSLNHFGAYVAAFGALFVFDLAWTLLRDRLVDQMPYRTSIENYVGIFRFDAILTSIAFAMTLPAVDEPLILLDDRSARLAARDPFARPARALHGDARAAARLPRHRDAALRRRRVRRQVHRGPLALGRRPGPRHRQRAWRRPRAAPGARVRCAAARRRQDRHSQGDPQQAVGAHRERVRGHEDTHDRGAVHARPRRWIARQGRRDRALLPRALGRQRLPGWPSG